MKRMWLRIAVLGLAGAGLALVFGDKPARLLGQEEAREEERGERRESEEKGEREEAAEREAEKLERRLDEIEQLIERAKDNDDEAQVRKLREEGERLIDRLEKLERQREGDEDEERGEEEEEQRIRARELELHRMELEVERLHQELEAARQESAIRLLEVAKDPLASASYAVSQLLDELEPEEAIETLVDLREKTENANVRRIISHHLVRVYRHADRPDEARRELRSLIPQK